MRVVRLLWSVAQLLPLLHAQIYSPDFTILSEAQISLNFSSVFWTTSAISDNSMLLAWTEGNNTYFSVRPYTDPSQSTPIATLGTCTAPQAAGIPGTNVFVVGCLQETALLFAVVSDLGQVETKDTVKSDHPADLRLLALPASQIVSTFTSHDNDSFDVYFILIDRNGVSSASQTRGNLFLQGTQRHALPVPSQNGFTLFWESLEPYAGIKRQRFALAGGRLGPEDFVVNRTDIRLLAAVTAGDQQIYILSREDWGETELFLSRLEGLNVEFTGVTGLPRPLWRLSDLYISAVNEDRLILGLNYVSAAGLGRSFLLSFAVTGCHFSGYELGKGVGDVRIAGMEVVGEEIKVVLAQQVRNGFVVDTFRVPAASICFSTTSTPDSFPPWVPRTHNPRNLPEVLIVVSGIIAVFALVGCVVGCCKRGWPRKLEQDEEIRRLKTVQGISDLSFSKASMIIEEEKLS